VTAHPVIVELVGPAGAGKSSLLRALAERDGSLRTGLHPPRHRHLPNAVALVPTFVSLHRGVHRVLWKEMRRITYLRTLHRILVSERSRSHRPVVLDEGPVYMLARMWVYGEDEVTSRVFEPWWHGAFESWAGVLDLIIWLDAPNTVLIDRLRARPQSHRAQDLSDSLIHEFLESYRAAYTRIISALAARRHARVLTFRTDAEPVVRIAERVATAMRDGRG
jgi:deoxyadenosine/deoxycytidine kinase